MTKQAQCVVMQNSCFSQHYISAICHTNQCSCVNTHDLLCPHKIAEQEQVKLANAQSMLSDDGHVLSLRQHCTQAILLQDHTSTTTLAVYAHELEETMSRVH